MCHCRLCNVLHTSSQSHLLVYQKQWLLSSYAVNFIYLQHGNVFVMASQEIFALKINDTMSYDLQRVLVRSWNLKMLKTLCCLCPCWVVQVMVMEGWSCNTSYQRRGQNMGKWGWMWEDVEMFCMVCMELPLYLIISKKNYFVFV